MSGEIRKLRDLGGSGGVTIPKEKLREWGLIDDDELADAHFRVDETDESVTFELVQ
ncbi:MULTISPECIES: hypothetical protein [unclassified Halorubrum]|uniref:hypothetical protein n=1 Tax=unclassified Halorubrum TaxID=2642239 RepID=UPI0013054698|nr:MULTISPECIES: hypothetical protein [unclassified Halorubrum]